MMSPCSEAAVGLRESVCVRLLGHDFGQCWERHKVQRRCETCLKLLVGKL